MDICECIDQHTADEASWCGHTRPPRLAMIRGLNAVSCWEIATKAIALICSFEARTSTEDRADSYIRGTGAAMAEFRLSVFSTCIGDRIHYAMCPRHPLGLTEVESPTRSVASTVSGKHDAKWTSADLEISCAIGVEKLAKIESIRDVRLTLGCPRQYGSCAEYLRFGD